MTSNHNRYMTRRIAYELPEDLVMSMWMKIDELEASSDGHIDYLQVFELRRVEDDLGQASQLIYIGVNSLPMSRDMRYLWPIQWRPRYL